MEGIENKEVKTRRQSFLDKMREGNPDVNYEDDEAIFGAIDDNMTNLQNQNKRYEDESRKIVDMMRSNPRAARMFSSWAKGEDPIMFLLENFGDEFKTALDDPENREKFAEAHNKWLENTAKNKKLQEEADDNMIASFDVLEKLQNEHGWTDEQTISIFNKVHDIILKGIANTIEPETFIMVSKAMNYDTDVKEAEKLGEVRGRNTRIEDMKRTRKEPENIPPTLGSGSVNPNKNEQRVYSNPFAVGGKVKK